MSFIIIIILGEFIGAMNIQDLLNKVKNKIKGDNQQKPCPTPVLLYIAAEWNYHSSVEPWYGHIKELTGGVDKNSPEFHSAVICGMYPQIKPASVYFVEKAEKYLKENKPSVEEWHKKSTKRKIKEGLQKIELETMHKFGLLQTYDIYNLSEEQRKNIKTNLLQTENNLINQTINKCSPVIQILARALKNDILNVSEHHPLAFANSMKLIQNRLGAGKDNNLKPNYTDYTFPQERYEITKQIFEMQDNGILDEKFNIKDFPKFKSSKLVCKFPYRGKFYNLENKITISQQNTVSSIER